MSKLNKAERAALKAAKVTTVEVKPNMAIVTKALEQAAKTAPVVEAAATEPKVKRLPVLRARNGAVATFRHLDKWVPTITAGGNKSADNGDDAAQALRGLTIDEAYKVTAKRIAVAEGELRARYGALNLGQQRMNLGNRIRGAIKRAAKAAAAPVVVA